MKNKISKIIFFTLLPIICFAVIGFFGISSFVNSKALAYSGNGGVFYVGKNSVYNHTSGTISGASATNGGAFYVENGGKLNINGGTISNNTASKNGNDIYNAGTVTVTGGTIGASGQTATGFGIYNTGTLNLYGGNIYDNIYSSGTLNTKVGANIQGQITLSDTATIMVEDYAGITPNYKINLASTRNAGTIITFKGSSTEPDLSAITINGIDSNYYAVSLEKDENGNWCLINKRIAYDFSSNWKSEVSSSTYMTTTLTASNLTSIKFLSEVPTGYTQIGALSTGLPVYQSNSTITDIAFVATKINAPKSCYRLFYSLSNLTSITFGNFDTSKVTGMNSMFDGCRSLTSLDVSNFNTSNVTRMDSMFYNCSSLTSLDVSNFDTSKVTDMGDMFSSCSSLTSLDLSSFDMSKVTSSSYMLNFGSSNKIQTLKTPYNNTSELAISTGSTLYYNGEKVTSVPAGLTESRTYTNVPPSVAFPTTFDSELRALGVSSSSRLDILFDFTVPSGYNYIGNLSTGLKVYQSSADSSAIAFIHEGAIVAPESCYRLFYDDRLYIYKKLIFKNFDTSNVTDMRHMFEGGVGGVSETLDISCFNTSNVTNMSGMFRFCTQLISLDLSNFNTTNVTSMEKMFYNCRNLTSLDVSNFDTANVTDMGFMFMSCSSLTSLDVSNFDTSKVTYMGDMFSNCSSLTSLDVSNFDTANVTDMGFMFYSCSSLTSLDVSNFDTANVTDMGFMFYSCRSLTSLDLSSFDMSKVTSSSYMLNFGSSNKIQTLKTPYNNTSELAITTGSTLYYNGSVVTSVPAGLTASRTYTASASGFIAGGVNNACLLVNSRQNAYSNNLQVVGLDLQNIKAKVPYSQTNIEILYNNKNLNQFSVLVNTITNIDLLSDKRKNYALLFGNKRYKAFYEPKVYEIA